MKNTEQINQDLLDLAKSIMIHFENKTEFLTSEEHSLWQQADALVDKSK